MPLTKSTQSNRSILGDENSGFNGLLVLPPLDMSELAAATGNHSERVKRIHGTWEPIVPLGPIIHMNDTNLLTQLRTRAEGDLVGVDNGAVRGLQTIYVNIVESAAQEERDRGQRGVGRECGEEVGLRETNVEIARLHAPVDGAELDHG